MHIKEMHAEIEQADRRFQRFFLLFNLGWMLVSLASLTLSLIGTFSDHPEYLREWRGIVIFALAFLIPLHFGFLLFHGHRNRPRERSWPPPFFFTLLLWGSLYLITTLLCILDANFVWNYFTVLGITYSFFQGRRVLAPILIIFLSYCFFAHLLAWPLNQSNLGGLFGIGLTFLSLTIVCLTIQYLLCERFERRRLLQQLATTNEELAAAHQRLAESAAQEQELAVLRERGRLAREMHDTLGHALALVAVKLEAAQRLRAVDGPRCEQELEATKEIVRASMKELRASIANLRSPALEREPACRALSRYAREMGQRCDLRISYDLQPDIENLPEAIEETLWRVGQEALTNIEKHSHARNVLLHISRQPGQIQLKIVDDGVGLPTDISENTVEWQSPAGHYGLNGMQERVKNVQGHLSIYNNGANTPGTTVEVVLPLVSPSPTLDIRSSELVF